MPETQAIEPLYKDLKLDCPLISVGDKEVTPMTSLEEFIERLEASKRLNYLHVRPT